MAQPIHESIISTYRLRKDLLEDYLKTRFAGFGKEYFNVHLSEDGQEFWCYSTPRPLTRNELQEIEDNVRVKSNHHAGDME